VPHDAPPSKPVEVLQEDEELIPLPEESSAPAEVPSVPVASEEIPPPDIDDIPMMPLGEADELLDIFE